MNLISLVKIANNEAIKDYFLKKQNIQIIAEQKKQDESGKTALMHAIIQDRPDIVKLLCQKEKIDIAGFNIQDKDGMTAVMYAARNGHQNSLKFFYNIPGKLTDDQNIRDFSYTVKNHISGYNALMLAIMNRHIHCLEFLYCKEIQYIINHQDNNGKTAIMLAFDAIAVANKFGNSEEVKNAKCLLNELLQVIKVIFKERSEMHLNILQNNKLDLTIQDLAKRNLFSYPTKTGYDMKKLLNFIASLLTSQITPDLSIKMPTGQHDKVKRHDNSQIIKELKKPKTHKRSATEEINHHDVKQAKIEKTRGIKNNNKQVQVKFNKPNHVITKCEVDKVRLRSGIQNTQFCVPLKAIGLSEGSTKYTITITPTKEWFYSNSSGISKSQAPFYSMKTTCSDTVVRRVCNGTKNKKSTPNSKLIVFHPGIPQSVQKVCTLASQAIKI